MSSNYRSIPSLLLAAFAGAVGSQLIPDFQEEVRTRNLVIVDQNGNEVGRFGGDELGSFLRLGADGYRDQSIMIYASNLKDMGGGASMSVRSRIDSGSGYRYSYSSVSSGGLDFSSRLGETESRSFSIVAGGLGLADLPFASFRGSSTLGEAVWYFPFESRESKQESDKRKE